MLTFVSAHATVGRIILGTLLGLKIPRLTLMLTFTQDWVIRAEIDWRRFRCDDPEGRNFKQRIVNERTKKNVLTRGRTSRTKKSATKSATKKCDENRRDPVTVQGLVIPYR